VGKRLCNPRGRGRGKTLHVGITKKASSFCASGNRETDRRCLYTKSTREHPDIGEILMIPAEGVGEKVIKR